LLACALRISTFFEVGICTLSCATEALASIELANIADRRIIFVAFSSLVTALRCVDVCASETIATQVGRTSLQIVILWARVRAALAFLCAANGHIRVFTFLILTIDLSSSRLVQIGDRTMKVKAASFNNTAGFRIVLLSAGHVFTMGFSRIHMVDLVWGALK